MRFFVISIFACFYGLGLMHAESVQEDCDLKQPAQNVQIAIDKSINGSVLDRTGQESAVLRKMLSERDSTCRDRIALQQALYVLDVQDKTSETGPRSAEYILEHSDDFDQHHLSEAIRIILTDYKKHQRYKDLILMWKNPVVHSDAKMRPAARDAFMMGVLALAGEEKTLEILTPLADERVGADDWWLMHFAHAVSERSGKAELAKRFLEKANGIYTPVRPQPFLDDLAGDKADKMLKVATYAYEKPDVKWSPVSPPVPTYPFGALRKGISGSCEVVFDVSIQGKPENVTAYCTSKHFNKEAERAIKQVRFSHPDENPPPAFKIHYPLDFRMEY